MIYNIIIYILTSSAIINMLSTWFFKPLGKIIDTIYLNMLVIGLVITSILTFFFKINSNMLLNILLIFILIFFFCYIFIVSKKVTYTEYSILIIFLIISIIILLIEFNLINIYLALEIQAMLFYTLIAAKANTKNTLESAIKYFIFNALASIVFIFGISYFYSLTGSVDINFIIEIIDLQDFSFLLGSLLIILTFIIKLGIYPFHSWLVDIYHGAPLHILLILLTIPKIILYILVFFFNIFIGSKILSLFLAFISMIFGFYKAILQINLQRFLAYTAIGSNGYFLSLTVLSDFFTFISLIFNLLIYSTITILTLLITFCLRETNLYFTKIYHLFSLKKVNFTLCICLLFAFLNSASIPPLAGFFQKLVLFYVFIKSFNILFVLGLIIISIFVSFIYLRLITFIYFFSNSKGNMIIIANKLINLLIIIITLLTIIFSSLDTTLIWNYNIRLFYKQVKKSLKIFAVFLLFFLLFLGLTYQEETALFFILLYIIIIIHYIYYKKKDILDQSEYIDLQEQEKKLKYIIKKIYITMCFFNLMFINFCIPYLVLLHPNTDVQDFLLSFHDFIIFFIFDERIFFAAILTSYTTLLKDFRDIKHGKIFNKEIYQEFLNVTKKYLRLNFFHLFLLLNIYIIIVGNNLVF